MLSDVKVVLPNRPGTLAACLEALAEAEINVIAMCGDIRAGERWGYIHVLVDDPDLARETLERRGFEIADVHPVVIHEIENRPGSAHEIIRSYREAEKNIEVMYSSDRGLVIGTEDMRPPRPGVKMKDAHYQG